MIDYNEIGNADPEYIRRCPFCGSDTVGCEVLDDGWKFVEVCRTCKARGPMYRTMPEALKGWNTRYDDALKDEIYQFVKAVCSADALLSKMQKDSVVGGIRD